MRDDFKKLTTFFLFTFGALDKKDVILLFNE